MHLSDASLLSKNTKKTNFFITVSKFQAEWTQRNNFFPMMALKFQWKHCFHCLSSKGIFPFFGKSQMCSLWDQFFDAFFVGCVSRHSHQRSLFTSSCSWQGSHWAPREAVSREHRVTPHHGSRGTHGSRSMLLIFHCLAAAATTTVWRSCCKLWNGERVFGVPGVIAHWLVLPID